MKCLQEDANEKHNQTGEDGKGGKQEEQEGGAFEPGCGSGELAKQIGTETDPECTSCDGSGNVRGVCHRSDEKKMHSTAYVRGVMMDQSVWALFAGVVCTFLLLQYPFHPRRNFTRVRVRDVLAVVGLVAIWVFLVGGERKQASQGTRPHTTTTPLWNFRNLAILITTMIFTAFFLHMLTHRFPYSFASGSRPSPGMLALTALALFELGFALYIEFRERGLWERPVELVIFLLPRLLLPVLWLLLEACLANRGPNVQPLGIHLHHYQIAFLLLLFFGRDRPMSAFVAGLLLGILVEGVAVYGAAPFLVRAVRRWPEPIQRFEVLSSKRIRIYFNRPWQDGMTDTLEFFLP